MDCGKSIHFHRYINYSFLAIFNGKLLNYEEIYIYIFHGPKKTRRVFFPKDAAAQRKEFCHVHAAVLQTREQHLGK